MSRIELIGEISSNHGGDLSLAKEFIHAFAEAGADFCKFQTTRVKHLRKGDPQAAWFQQSELSEDAHWELKDECERRGTKFLTTVYNAEEVPFLASLGLEAIKIGSGEAGEQGLADAVRGQFHRVFVSLGLWEKPWDQTPFADAHEVTPGWNKVDLRVTYFRCITRYPSPSAAPLLWPEFKRPVTGYSDHAVGLAGCHLAIFRGATIIETHVQLPRRQARDPKPFEKTVQEFRQLRAFADEDTSRWIGRWQAG
jgi:N,N'-diacetyllegionaminate synthase